MGVVRRRRPGDGGYAGRERKIRILAYAVVAVSVAIIHGLAVATGDVDCYVVT